MSIVVPLTKIPRPEHRRRVFIVDVQSRCNTWRYVSLWRYTCVRRDSYSAVTLCLLSACLFISRMFYDPHLHQVSISGFCCVFLPTALKYCCTKTATYFIVIVCVECGFNIYFFAPFMVGRPSRLQYAAGTLPKPKNKNVKIRSVPAHRMVAVRFRGRSPDEVKEQSKFYRNGDYIYFYSFHTVMYPPCVFVY